MARHTMMWLLACSSALLGAAVTFAMRKQFVLTTARYTLKGTDKFRDWLAGCCDQASRGRPDASRDPYYNAAYDEYRAAVLQRLAEEEREFTAFLDRIRVARDRREFDAFLAERRTGARVAPQ